MRGTLHEPMLHEFGIARRNRRNRERVDVKTLSSVAVVAVALAILAGGAGRAAEPVGQHNTNAFWFDNWGDLTNARLTVSMPNGRIESVEAAAGTPVFQLTGPNVLDGVYAYELSAATGEKVEIVNPIDNGRGDSAATTANKPFYLTGAFHVSRGVIVTPETLNEDGDSQ